MDFREKITAGNYRVRISPRIGRILRTLGADQLGKYGRSYNGDAFCAVLPLSAADAYSRVKAGLSKLNYTSGDQFEKKMLYPNEAYDLVILTDTFYYDEDAGDPEDGYDIDEQPIVFLTVTGYTPKTSVVTVMVDQE